MPTLTGFHLGRRGISLLFFGLLDIVYCISLLNPDRVSRQSPFLASITHLAPLPAWAALWGITGILCLIFASRWNDRIGFAAAIFLKITWATACVFAWLNGGAERGYVSAAIWLALAGFVWVLAGWPEAPEGRSGWTRPSSSPSSPASPDS